MQMFAVALPHWLDPSSWGTPSPWIAIGISAVALVAAIVYPRRGNRIAKEALAIAEREETQREGDRKARARLAISFAPVNVERDEGGISRMDGSHGTVRLAIEVRNAGDRESGRAEIEVTAPLVLDNPGMRWSDRDGRDISARPQPASRLGDRYLLTRSLDGIARDVPETFYVSLAVVIPRPGHDPLDCPVAVRVIAQDAEGEATDEYPLRIAHARSSSA